MSAFLVPGDSPIRCTPDEIKQKHKQAREKLLAKRQLPFTVPQQSNPTLSQQIKPAVKKTSFQLKIPSNINRVNNSARANNPTQKTNSDIDIKLIIERKRQEALLKLRKRLPLNK